MIGSVSKHCRDGMRSCKQALKQPYFLSLVFLLKVSRHSVKHNFLLSLMLEPKRSGSNKYSPICSFLCMRYYFGCLAIYKEAMCGYSVRHQGVTKSWLSILFSRLESLKTHPQGTRICIFLCPI